MLYIGFWGVVKKVTEDEISYKYLRRIQQIEKNQPLLSEIKTGFYNELNGFIRKLEERLEKETSDQKKNILEEEIENIKKIACNIYEQREKKIVLSAISQVRGGHPDTSNMLPSEKKMFDGVVNFLLQSREEIFKGKNETDTADIDEEDVKPDNPKEKPTLDEKEKNESNTNPIVRVNEDIPVFIGTDEKKYYLRRNDVISLPNDMKEVLSKRGVVEELESLP